MQTQTRTPPRPSPLDHGVAAAIRRRPITAFLVWFFTVGQAIAFVPIVARHRYGTELPTEPFIIGATLVGLMLPTVGITWLTDGIDGVRALLRRTVAIRVPVRWYAFAVVGVPFSVVAVWALASGAPEEAGASVVTSALGSGLLLQMVVLFVTINLWEEVAWAGFVQARLQDRHGPIRAAVITGVLFALGHISLVIEGSVSAVLVVLALLVAVCIPFRALQALVYNRTGSLVPVGLVHAAGNATAAGSVLGAGLFDRLYPGDGAGGLVFPVLGSLGLVAIAATRGRLGYGRRR